MQSRREFLRSTAAGAALSPAALRAQGAQQPNILWIIAEDFSPDLSCYGNTYVHTPRIDKLAAEGVRFTNAFTTAPVCSASRSAIATGMYQTSVGGHNHRSHRDDGYTLPSPVRVFTEYLREAGYHTSNLRNKHGLQGTGKTDLNYAHDGMFDGDDWSQRNPGQPFYAQINFHETHRAFARFPDRPVDPASIQLPPYYPDHPAIRLDMAAYYDSAQHLDVKVARVLDRLQQEGLAENTIVFFFGDHGRPMPRGKQFLYDEGIRIPLIVRMPDRLRAAGYKPGSVSDDLTSAIDITATTLTLAGVTPPKHLQGRPIFGENAQARDHIIAGRDRCDETVDRIRCVRDKRFKYIRNGYPERAYTQPNKYKDTQYPTLRAMRDLHAAGKLSGPSAEFMADRRPAEELYDLQADPYEVRNLAADPKQKAQLNRMRAQLDSWIKETGDQGQVAEKQLPRAESRRSQLEGWCTEGGTTKATEAGLQATLERNSHLMRSVVAPPGEYSLELRARSKELRPSSVQWGTIYNMRDRGNTAKLEFVGDGEWHTVSAPFSVKDDWLGLITIPLDGGPGTVDVEFIRLKQGTRTVEAWDFRTPRSSRA
jgi:arylsulfatase A-like enzyme